MATKYRGTDFYIAVLTRLVQAARYGGLLSYQDVAVLIGIRASSKASANQIGHVCREISEDEVNAGRPMLGALVISAKGLPGKEFFRCAKNLGRFPLDLDEKEFWETERDAVYATWRRPNR
jgi:hypothetical protein